MSTEMPSFVSMNQLELITSYLLVLKLYEKSLQKL